MLDQKGYIVTSGRLAWEKVKPEVSEQFSNLTIEQFNSNYQYATNIGRIFAAGDCVDFSYRQATTAVGMGVAAELEVERFLENADFA